MGVRLGEMPLMYRGWISMRSPNMNRMMVAMREKIVVNFETWRLKGWEKNESCVFVFCVLVIAFHRMANILHHIIDRVDKSPGYDVLMDKENDQ